MTTKARILFDFDGDVENGELVIKEGDVIIVTDQDIGDGWWEGKPVNGDVGGLFPMSYAEIILEGEEAEDDVMVGATTLNGYQDGMGNGGGAMDEDEFQEGHGYHHNTFSQQGGGDEDDDDDDDEDWEANRRNHDDYDDEDEKQGGGVGGSGGHLGGGGEGREDVNSPGGRSNSQLARAGTVRKNIYRFSPFVKTGSEAFILGNVPGKVDIKNADKIKIVVSAENSPMWEPNPNPLTIEVKDPEKKKKFKGMKKFTAFNIIPSTTHRAVSRRFKHYIWLHERFEEKFSMHSVPPLPDKQYYGRYGEEFIDKRRDNLQRWSNRIARHPVLSRSNVFGHFILCDEGGSQWKTGKRRAEKDDILGAAYLQTIEHPDVSIEIGQAEGDVEAFGVFLRKFKLSLSRMRLQFIDHCNQMSGPIMGEFRKMAGAIGGLGKTFKMEDHEYARSLSEAILFTASTYTNIGEMHAEQPRNDMLPALDVMKEYMGLIFTFPDMVTIHKGAASKTKDCEKMKEGCRIDITDAAEITSRSESVSAAVMAEIYHFQHERIIDFREMMKCYLDEQIRFYTEITGKLQHARSRYNDGTDL